MGASRCRLRPLSALRGERDRVRWARCLTCWPSSGKRRSPYAYTSGITSLAKRSRERRRLAVGRPGCAVLIANWVTPISR